MGRTTNGAAAGQYSSSSSNNQQWTIEAAGDYVRIKNRATGLYLDGMGRTTGGTVVDSAASTRASPEFYQTYSLRNLSAGTHTVEIMVRSGSLVVDAVGVVRP